MEYTVGMKIQIKEESELRELFIEHKYTDMNWGYILMRENNLKNRGVGFGNEQFGYCGRVANITGLHRGTQGMYTLDVDNEKFYWIEAWLKPAVLHINIMD